MTTSKKISEVLSILQVHERLRWQLQQMLMRFTNASFMIVRAGMTIQAKYDACEKQRLDFLAALCALAAHEGIDLPAYLCGACREDSDAAR